MIKLYAINRTDTNEWLMSYLDPIERAFTSHLKAAKFYDNRKEADYALERFNQIGSYYKLKSKKEQYKIASDNLSIIEMEVTFI